ncbi:MAG: hypothetical protein IKS60_07475, partial [Lachnospiraceae bacterium]|nr:hypothetical protein [Lachnospiraceae bacterium]
MIELFESGAYLVNGEKLIKESPEALSEIKSLTGKETSKEEAKKGTIAYGILKKHNTSDNMDKLKIRFDKLT